MPRRALVFITLLVLTLHWAVLRGLPLSWDTPQSDSSRVFSTRSIAAAPAPATNPTAEAPATPPPAAQPPSAPKKRPTPPRTRPRPSIEAPTTAAPPPSEAAATPDSTARLATALDDPAQEPAAVPPEAVSVAAAASGTAPPASAASAPAPAEPPLAAQPTNDTSAGTDIAPPGGGARPVPGAEPPPVRLPPPARLAFDVSGQAKKFAYNARAELLWQHDGNRYEARQEISAFLVGTRAQRSVGAITAQGLQPERFSDRSRSEQAAHFDAAKGRVTFSANTPDATVGPGAQDRLSVFIQLGALLAADPARFVPGTQVTLTTVSARSADRWTFSLEGPETLDLPSGPTPTLKLQRLPRKEYDQKAELWVAPALGYLPVRIRLTQANGDFADLQLRAASTP